MNGNDYGAYIRALFSDSSTAMKSALERRADVDVGIVRRVPAKGLVDVEMAASFSPDHIRTIRCILISPASKVLSLDIAPSVGDRVLVLTPYIWANGMLDPDNTDVTVAPDAPCNAMLYGFALLMNQVQTGKHENLVSVDKDGALSLSLLYDKDTGKYGAELSVDKDGAVTVKNRKSSVVLSKDGKVTVTGDSSQDMELSANGCTVKLTGTGVSINGKLTIKN